VELTATAPAGSLPEKPVLELSGYNVPKVVARLKEH
jgi:hypothetical protein